MDGAEVTGSWWRGALTGVLAGGAALGVGQFIAGFTGASSSPVVAVDGAIARLDDTGAATALTAPLARPIVDLAADASGQLYAIGDDGQLVRFAGDGTLEGASGFDGAHRVACPASGDCAVVGLANGLDKYLIELAP